MWKYSQTSGALTLNEESVAIAYSGRGAGRDNPAYQQVIGTGPVPQGRYTISDPFHTDTLKFPVFRLTPSKETETFGRMGFLIHGDNADHNASHGCIVADHTARVRIEKSGDTQLEVTA